MTLKRFDKISYGSVEPRNRVLVASLSWRRRRSDCCAILLFLASVGASLICLTHVCGRGVFIVSLFVATLLRAFHFERGKHSGNIEIGIV